MCLYFSGYGFLFTMFNNLQFIIGFKKHLAALSTAHYLQRSSISDVFQNKCANLETLNYCRYIFVIKTC